MNLDDRVQLRRFNAARQREPFGPHSRRPSKVNWWALVIPAGMVLGAPLLWAFLQIVTAWLGTL